MIVVEGNIVTDEKEFYGQVHIEHGVIKKIVTERGRDPDHEFGKRFKILPGFINVHAHMREDEGKKQCYKEDFESYSLAALTGGITLAGAMPNTPEPIVTAKQLEYQRDCCLELLVDTFHYVGVGKGTRPLDELVAYKAYTGPSVGDLFFKSAMELEDALQHYEGQLISFHIEDYDLLKKFENDKNHTLRRPEACVIEALGYALEFIEKYKIPAKLCHWSTAGESFSMIQDHRKRGYNTLLEVSPMHLFFDYEMMQEHPELWTRTQMNPAIQSRAHRLALCEALRTGFIDMVATDHAPHTREEKLKNFKHDTMTHEEHYQFLLENDPIRCYRRAEINGMSGAPQDDNYGDNMLRLLQGRHGMTPFTLQDIVRVTSLNPGKFVNGFHKGSAKYGKLEPGHYGNLTVLDMEGDRVIDDKDVKSKVGWTPYHGAEVTGRVHMTMVRGEAHYQNGV